MAETLSAACRKGSSIGIYKALRADMARKLEETESGRDYAAIVKSFVDVQERIDAIAPSSADTIKVNRLAAAAEKRARA